VAFATASVIDLSASITVSYWSGLVKPSTAIATAAATAVLSSSVVSSGFLAFAAVVRLILH